MELGGSTEGLGSVILISVATHTGVQGMPVISALSLTGKKVVNLSPVSLFY